MTVSPEIVKKAVEKGIQAIQAQADEARDRQAVFDQATNWENLPETVSDDEIAALLVVANTDPMAAMQLGEDMAKAIMAHLSELQASDPDRHEAIMKAVEAGAKGGGFQKGALMIETLVEPPVDGSNDWTVVAVPLVVSDDFEVKIPDTLGADLYLGIHVTPRDGAGLTEQFNIPAQCIPMGQTVEPLAISCEGSNGMAPKKVHVYGHLSNGDTVQPLYLGRPLEDEPSAPGDKPAGPSPS